MHDEHSAGSTGAYALMRYNGIHRSGGFPIKRLRMQPMPFGENGGSEDKDRARRAHGAKRRSLGNCALVRARGKAP